MTPEDWLAAAEADADRRGLPELKPLLATLARSMAALRKAEEAFDAGASDADGEGRAG